MPDNSVHNEEQRDLEINYISKVQFVPLQLQGVTSLLAETKFSDSIRPIFLEVCAGCAILSFFVSALSKTGVQVVAIDNEANRHSPKVPILKLDLRRKDQVHLILQLISSGSVAGSHLAVPCGTCSRAREIPLKSGFGPKPLRSDSYPLGLPGLSEEDSKRVQAANEVYDSAFDIMDALLLALAAIGLENPDRSILWLFPRAILLLTKGFVDARFQHCKWTLTEPMRPKWVRLRTNCESFRVLDGPCNAEHVHLGWGRTETGEFRTALDAEYPPEMASVLADLYITEIALRGYSNAKPTTPHDCMDAPLGKRIRASTTKQPRGKSIPSLISEFKEVIYCKRSEACGKAYRILKGSVPLHLIQEQGLHLDTVASTTSVETEEQAVPSPDDQVTAGIFREPRVFLQEALKLKHPVDTFLDQSLPLELLESLALNLRNPPADTIKLRVDAVKSLVKLLQDNTEDDKNAIAGMDAFSKVIMEGKKLFTLGVLAKKWNFQDSTIVSDLQSGFRLTGMQPFCKAFRHELRMPEVSEEALRLNSALNNKLNLVRTTSSGDHALDESFHNQALQEQTKGWLVGPFASVEDYSKVMRHEPHLSRRFPLEQEDKTRSIDDMLESGINTTYGCQDKIFLHGVDFIAQTIRTIERVLSGHRSVVSDKKEMLSLSVHKKWDSLVNRWLGKTIDLAEAYKQCPTHPESRWASAITVYNPKSKTADIFGQVTLPFGASAAVLAFNRVSRLLYFLGCKELALIWSAFFDDFTVLSPEAVSESASTSAVIVLKLLGWRVSEKPGKVKPWAELFVTLGVVFDISRISEGLSLVSNKPDRVAKIVADLSGMLESKRATAKQCESTRGKLNYSEAQIFGRVSKGKLRVFARKSGSGKSFSTEDCAILVWLIKWLEVSTPRPVTSPFKEPPLILFTDGACEPVKNDPTKRSLVTCGAVLLDRRDKTAQYFGVEITKDLTDEWFRITAKLQLVTEAELLPQLLARALWKDRIAGSKLLSFVDSEPAKFSLIRGTSDTVTCADIVAAVSFFDAEQLVWSWFLRVPSYSNLADAPSRLEPIGDIPGFKVFACEPIQPISLIGGFAKFG